MSKTNHTPGPWRIGDAGQTIFGPLSGEPSPKTIARIPKVSAPCQVSDLDANIANAQLIAAAPELLVALVQIEDEINRTGSPSADGWDKARQAIAKATGRPAA